MIPTSAAMSFCRMPSGCRPMTTSRCSLDSGGRLPPIGPRPNPPSRSSSKGGMPWWPRMPRPNGGMPSAGPRIPCPNGGMPRMPGMPWPPMSVLAFLMKAIIFCISSISVTLVSMVFYLLLSVPRHVPDGRAAPVCSILQHNNIGTDAYRIAQACLPVNMYRYRYLLNLRPPHRRPQPGRAESPTAGGCAPDCEQYQ